MPTLTGQVMPALVAILALTACRGEPRPTSAIAAYRDSFAQAAGSTFTSRLARHELLEQVRTVRVLWLGDHHRSARLHALHLELLRELHDAGIPMVLALEAIGQQDEADVAAHLRGELDLNDLRGRVRARWSGSWLDDAELDPFYYRSLLGTGRRCRAPVFGLEPTPRLPMAERDPHIATTVQAIAHAHPDRLVVVVVGQAHLIGDGDLITRTGLPHLALGGEPPAELRDAAPSDTPARGTLLASDGGLWWFSELL